MRRGRACLLGELAFCKLDDLRNGVPVPAGGGNAQLFFDEVIGESIETTGITAADNEHVAAAHAKGFQPFLRQQQRESLLHARRFREEGHVEFHVRFGFESLERITLGELGNLLDAAQENAELRTQQARELFAKAAKDLCFAALGRIEDDVAALNEASNVFLLLLRENSVTSIRNALKPSRIIAKVPWSRTSNRIAPRPSRIY